MTRCKNCDTPLQGAYCLQCGQKDVELERPLHDLLGEVLRETFDVDGRAARTVWTLFRHPGLLTREFLAGHRKRYTPPFRLYLVISVLFFVVVAWVAGLGILLGDGQTVDADAPEQARFFADELPRLMFVLLPVFALLLKIAYRQRFYFDHLIHSLHLHSAAYVMMALLLPLEQAATRNWLLLVIQLILFGLLLAGFVISLHRVYGAGWPITAAKAIGILLAYMGLVAISFDVLSHFVMPDWSALFPH